MYIAYQIWSVVGRCVRQFSLTDCFKASNVEFLRVGKASIDERRTGNGYVLLGAQIRRDCNASEYNSIPTSTIYYLLAAGRLTVHKRKCDSISSTLGDVVLHWLPIRSCSTACTTWHQAHDHHTIVTVYDCKGRFSLPEFTARVHGRPCTRASGFHYPS